MAVTIRTEGLVDKERLRATLQLIRNAGERGITKTQLSKKLGDVSSRTVDRAIMLLEAQGARIDKPRRGAPAVIHFTLAKGPTWDEHVSADTRLALRLAALSLSQGGTALWQDKLEALERLASERMSNKDREVFQQLSSAVKIQGGVDDPIESQDALEPILKALQGPKGLEVDYQAPGARKPARHEVVPYALTHDLFSGGTFLLAWEPSKKRAIHLRLSRIAKAKPLRAASIPDPSLLERAATYQIGGWTTTEEPFVVKVRVDGEPWVLALKEAPPVLPDFSCTPAKDGASATVSFKANHANGALRWVLQFGEAAEVLEPKALRQEMKQRLQAAAKRYK